MWKLKFKNSSNTHTQGEESWESKDLRLSHTDSAKLNSEPNLFPRRIHL